MNITIVGAGNIGTQFAAHCAEKGHCVTMFTSKPDKISKVICVVDENDRVLHEGAVSGATSNAKEAFESADLIFVTVPAFCMREIAEAVQPFAKNGMKICIVPGTGGGECAFKACIANGAVVFGLQRVPSVARLVEYGHTVRAIGYRGELFVAALPAKNAAECANTIEGLFDIKCSAMPNYLNLTMTPSNPILHTTRLRTLFLDYEPGRVYERIPLFYEEWDDRTSELLFACDREVQEVCKEIHGFDLSYVKSLCVHYESETPAQLTRKIKSISGFKGLKSPEIQLANGYFPDLESRYFTADFPFGLSILVQIAEFTGVEHKNMTETLEWYYRLSPPQKEFRFSDYGICTFEQFLNFYSI